MPDLICLPKGSNCFWRTNMIGSACALVRVSNAVTFLKDTSRNQLEPVGTSWNLLEPVGTCWNQLEPVKTSWNRLEPDCVHGPFIT